MALNGGTDEAEARRERLDRASRAMGDLLLRGYRMLGSACPKCGTVLLQDKEQRLLCVSCQDPEGGHAAPPRPERCEGAAAAFRGSPGAGPGADPGGAVAAARAALLQKLLWAARELPRSGCAESSARLCRLLRDCALALRALRHLESPGEPRDCPESAGCHHRAAGCHHGHPGCHHGASGCCHGASGCCHGSPPGTP